MVYYHLCNALAIFSVYATYLTTLATSIILYRLSPFHPLAKYPGPAYLKVSKVFGAIAAGKGDYHRVLRQLHDQYGPVVRVGTQRHRFYQDIQVS